jgi:hypothetical protein
MGDGLGTWSDVMFGGLIGSFYHVRGDDYFHGRGVAVDHVKAVGLWIKGAEAGNVQCMLNLSWAYRDGIGVAKDEAKANEWGTKAKASVDVKAKEEAEAEDRKRESRKRRLVIPCAKEVEVGASDFVLLTQYYEDSSPMRQAENDLALKMNLANPLFRKIVLFMERDVPFYFGTDRIERVVINDRMHFGDAFEHMRGKPGIKVVANSDIYFDGTLGRVADFGLDGRMYAVTRRDLEYDKFEVVLAKPTFMMPIEPIWSHDAWMYRDDLPEFKSDYYLGVWGCEAEMSNAAMRAGVKVLNVFRYVNAIHVHWSVKRNWTDGLKTYGMMTRNTSLVPVVYDLKGI